MQPGELEEPPTSTFRRLEDYEDIIKDQYRKGLDVPYHRDPEREMINRRRYSGSHHSSSIFHVIRLDRVSEQKKQKRKSKPEIENYDDGLVRTQPMHTKNSKKGQKRRPSKNNLTIRAPNI